MPRVAASRPRGPARPVTNLQAARRDWFRVVNHDSGDVEVQIYDEIGYWGVTAEDFVAEIRQITAPAFTLRINSPGGEVFDGLTIYNAILDHPAQVDVVVDGIAASAASFIAQAGDVVRMNRGAQMMIHDASGLCWGNAADMQDMADLLNKLSDQIAGIYAARGGGTVEAWRERMRDEMWLTGQEAVDTGLADEVVATPPRRGDDTDGNEDQDDGGPPANRWDLSVFRYAGRDAAPAPTPVPTAAVDGQAKTQTVAVLMDAGLDPVQAVADTATPPDQPTQGDPEQDRPDEPAGGEPAPEQHQDDESTGPADEWAEATAHLTTPDPEPSAEDMLAALREAS